MQNKKSSFGDLHGFEVTIDGRHATDSVVTLMIFQDLMTPVWSVNIEIVDTVNAASKIRPGATVSIILETKQGHDTDNRYKFDCFVHEIADRTQQSQNTVSLVLKCSTKGMLENAKQRVKKAFRDKTHDKIVESIVSDCLGGTVGDKQPTPEQHHPHTPFKKNDGSRDKSRADDTVTWLAPNILPLDAIAHMMRTARCAGKADFVFFTKDAATNKFGFESLSKMFNRRPVAKFVQRPTGIKQNGDYQYNANLEFSFFVFDHFDEIGSLANGYRGTTVATFDMLTKQWQATPSGEHASAVWKSLPVHKNIIDGSNLLDTGRDWFKSRRQELFKAEQNKLKIQTFGHASSFGWLGETCEIDVPSNDSIKDPDKLDDKYKGKYLIAAVAHYITHESYFNNIELVNGWSK
nr:MAG TPA: Baseplate wedge protein [Caudoviricetes sp.]